MLETIAIFGETKTTIGIVLKILTVISQKLLHQMPYNIILNPIHRTDFANLSLDTVL